LAFYFAFLDVDYFGNAFVCYSVGNLIWSNLSS